jgi:hypothetical protein
MNFVHRFFIFKLFKVTYNGLQLGEEADLEAQNCQATTKVY